MMSTAPVMVTRKGGDGEAGDGSAMPTARAVAATPSSPSVSPVPASIPIALEAAADTINALLCIYAQDLVGDDALRAARDRILQNGGMLYYVAITLETIRKAQADCPAPAIEARSGETAGLDAAGTKARSEGGAQ